MTAQLRTAAMALGITIFALAPSSGLAQAAAATSQPAGGSSKIAFVSLQEAVISCNEGKAQAAALQQRFASKQATLKSQDDELKKLKDDFQTVSEKLTDDARTSRLKVIQDKQKAFDREYQDYQAEIQEAQQEAVNTIVKKMLPVLEKFLSTNGYTAVLDVSSPQTPVIWVNRDSMITQQLVNAYNNQSPAAPTGSATPAQTKPAATKP